MSLRYFHRWHILPGVKLNLARHTWSVTLGGEKMPHVTLSKHGIHTSIPLGIDGAYIKKQYKYPWHHRAKDEHKTKEKKERPKKQIPEQESNQESKQSSLLGEIATFLLTRKE